MLLVLVQSDVIFRRITKSIPEQKRNPYINNVAELQRYLADHNSFEGALLDVRFRDFELAKTLLERFQISCELFEGDFTASDQWAKSFLQTQVVEDDSESPVEIQEAQNATESQQEMPQVEVIQEKTIEVTEQPATVVQKNSNTSNPYRKAGVKPTQSKSRPLLKRTVQPVEPILLEEDRKIPEPTNDAAPPEITNELQLPKEMRSEHTEPLVSRQESVIQVNRAPVPAQKVADVPLTLRPRLIIVSGLTPRAGTSFIAMELAYAIGRTIRQDGAVSLVEHPAHAPYYWDYFNCGGLINEKRYKHWLNDMRVSPLLVDQVGLVPLPYDHNPIDSESDKTIQYVYRELRRPFIIIDTGTYLDDALFQIADDIVLVVEVNPIQLLSVENAKRYQSIHNAYDSVHTVLNKWTKYANLRDEDNEHKFPNVPQSLYIPYLDPEQMQKAIWGGMFPGRLAPIQDKMKNFCQYFISQWVPKSLQYNSGNKKSIFSWRRGT